MADAVSDLIAALIQREGGYSNNSADRGGPTNWGVTISTLQAWRRQPVSAEDVQALTQEEAAEIYRTLYLKAPGFDQIADPQLQVFMFDFGVNSGQATASRALQTALGVNADGALGPISFAALNACKNLPALFYKVKCMRYELLLDFIGHDAEQAAFAIGWKNRVQQFNEAI